MASAGVDAQAAPTPEEATPAALVGVIVPPPQRKEVIDRTAKFVAAKGRKCEDELMARAGAHNAAQFSFILEEDPYHAYYLQKVEDFKSGVAAAPPTAPQQPPQPEKEKEKDDSTIVREATISLDLRSIAVKAAEAYARQHSAAGTGTGTETATATGGAPVRVPRDFSLERPMDATPLQLSLIRLTAERIALEGAKFEADLRHQLAESGADQEEFAFIHEGKPHHFYFSQLLAVYRRLLDDPASWAPRVQAIAAAEGGGAAFLERALASYELERAAREHDVASAEKRAADRAAFLEIDWHDFVVVETISFAPSAGAGMGTGTGARASAANANATAPASRTIAGDDDDEGPINVRSDYRVAAVGAEAAVPMVTLPDGRRVPASEVSSYIKAELQDPKWREQQDRFEQKHRDTNMEFGAGIVRSLAKQAGVRPDVFGGEEAAAAARLEEAKRKEREKPQWDGSAFTADAAKAAAAMAVANAASAAAAPSARPNVPLPVAPPPPPRAPAGPASVPLPVAPPPPAPTTSGNKRPAPSAATSTSTDDAAAAESAKRMAGSVTIAVPSSGAPTNAGILPAEVSVAMPGPDVDVAAFKETLSRALNNVAVGRLQIAVDGRFLKNNESVAAALLASESGVLEMKWKQR